MYFQSEWKTVWILIRWLHEKPADLDLQYFQNRINLGSAGQGSSMYFQSEWKTVLILIRWLHQEPADLDLQYFQNRINLGSAEHGITNIPLNKCIKHF